MACSGKKRCSGLHEGLSLWHDKFEMLLWHPSRAREPPADSSALLREDSRGNGVCGRGPGWGMESGVLRAHVQHLESQDWMALRGSTDRRGRWVHAALGCSTPCTPPAYADPKENTGLGQAFLRHLKNQSCQSRLGCWAPSESASCWRGLPTGTHHSPSGVGFSSAARKATPPPTDSTGFPSATSSTATSSSQQEKEVREVQRRAQKGKIIFPLIHRPWPFPQMSFSLSLPSIPSQTEQLEVTPGPYSRCLAAPEQRYYPLSIW